MAEMSEGAIKISWSEWQAQRAAKRAALAAYGLSGESRRTTARPEARRALQAFRVGNRVVRSLSCAVALVLAAGNVPAGTWHLAGTELARIDASAERNPSPLKVDMARIGTLRPRGANEITGSNWTLGCECLDRDFTDFDQYKDYIVPLGIKEIRLFAGWAKCEREPGKFDFAWLDRCVDWANAHGINVLLDISYGNPIYEGAGGPGLGNGTPNTPEGLAKWDVWIDRLGRHYKDRIRDYAMWNEPDGGKNTPAAIADLNVRTARILKRILPDCRLHGLSLASNEPKVFEACISEIAKLGGADLFDTFIYHGYAYNPDSSYARVEKLIEICAKYAPRAKMRQGENGCVSEWSDGFALSRYPWSEVSQAKWDMRRMLGDLGHGCRSSVYSICDLQYAPPGAPYVYLNRKGLLRANAKHQVYQIKKAYYAVQNVVSVFDDSLVRVAKPHVSTADRCLSLYEYAKSGKHPLFVFWDHGMVETKTVGTIEDGSGAKRPSPFVDTAKIGTLSYARDKDWLKTDLASRNGVPGDDFVTRPAMFDWEGPPLKEPVWVDLFTGAVYAIPATRQLVHSCGVSFVCIPVYDSPCLVTERAALSLLAPEGPRAAD